MPDRAPHARTSHCALEPAQRAKRGAVTPLRGVMPVSFTPHCWLGSSPGPAAVGLRDTTSVETSRRCPQSPWSTLPQRRSVRLRLAYLRMRLQIISESLDIFHRDQFLDPLRPSFKFDCHARETVSWRRRDPPKESFLVDDERDGFACRQRCARISLGFLVCHHDFPLLGALCGRGSTLSMTVPQAPRDILVLGVPTIPAPHPLRRRA